MDLAHVFLTPQNTVHRQYEALRAYFVDRVPGRGSRRTFRLHRRRLHQLAHQFRQNPERQFFAESPRQGPRRRRPIQQKIIQLRKQNQSVYDISEALKKEGISRTPAAVAAVLQQEGFAKLPAAHGRRASSGYQAHRRRSRGRAGPEPRTANHLHQVRRIVSVLAGAGGDGIRSRDRQVRPAGDPNGPGRHAHAEPLGLEVVRHPAAYPRDERGARRRAGIVRRAERHSQAVVPDRVQLPHRPGCYPASCDIGSTP